MRVPCDKRLILFSARLSDGKASSMLSAVVAAQSASASTSPSQSTLFLPTVRRSVSISVASCFALRAVGFVVRSCSC